MEKFTVTILGCGSAKPTLIHNPSSQLITIGGKAFLVDCGEGTQHQLMRYRCNTTRLRHIFISHLHGDHIYGLPGLVSTMGLQHHDAEIVVHLPKAGIPLLKPLMEYSAHDLNLRFEPYEHRRAVIYEDKTIEVETLPLVHSLPCCGFIFREKPKPRHIIREAIDRYEVPICRIAGIKLGNDYTLPDGRVIANDELTSAPSPSRAYAYVSDTLPLKAVAHAVKGIDLLYHEATHPSSRASSSKATCHSTAAQAAQIASLAEVKRLLIGHYSSALKGNDINGLLEEARAVFPATIASQEGMTIEI